MVLVFIRLLAIAAIIFWVVYWLRRTLAHQSPPRRVSDPYEVLCVTPTATPDEIRAAYHRELAKYHPDKVAHLGDEIQRVAREKTQSIIEAYQTLHRP